MAKIEWILCPVCGNKTRNQIREDRSIKSKAMETSDKIIYYVTKHSKFMASVEVRCLFLFRRTGMG